MLLWNINPQYEQCHFIFTHLLPNGHAKACNAKYEIVFNSILNHSSSFIAPYVGYVKLPLSEDVDSYNSILVA